MVPAHELISAAGSKQLKLHLCICCCPPCSQLYAVGMRQSAAWGLYLVVGTTAQSMSIALSLLLGGSMVLNGSITPEQLTSFMFYVQLVTTSSLAVCDQYGAIMEVGAGHWQPRAEAVQGTGSTGHRQPRRGMRLST